jgi:hypothetical protein
MRQGCHHYQQYIFNNIDFLSLYLILVAAYMMTSYNQDISGIERQAVHVIDVNDI